MTTELGRLIAHRIALTGPISIADFMAEALGHPRLGYYRHALPLGAIPIGAGGDFTTAHPQNALRTFVGIGLGRSHQCC